MRPPLAVASAAGGGDLFLLSALSLVRTSGLEYQSDDSSSWMGRVR